ncbi:site-specific integrase [Devosia sp. MC532]|uniref:site-specific integrase n=1 Tax=Devosia sp. MC532 TaxID=2799788 RepID=UPI0018F3BFAD|nr:site-specific integrase [Devosia sp. MC532]MBJ7578155.1 site-specific integrase [Devosia sp. MC532]
MPTGSNLKVRNSVYYVRLKVPVELHHLMNTRELARSLNTKDRRAANVRKLSVLSEWHSKFEELRRRRDMTEADFAAATWEHYSDELLTDEVERTLPELSNTRLKPTNKDHYLKTLREHLGSGKTVLIEWAADAYIERNRLLVDRSNTQYRELCFRLMRAQIEVLLRTEERDHGNYAGQPVDPIVTRPDASHEIAKPGERLSDLFEVYAKENPKAIADATLAQARRDIGTFIDLVGSDFPVTKLDKKAVREWKTLLQSYPVKATEMTIFKGLNFREIITANGQRPVPKPTISAKTVNRYLAGFGAFCNWLAAHDYIANNPFTDMYLTVDKTKTNVLPFTDEQLTTLFSSPLFTGCLNDKKWHVAGNYQIRDHRYWLPHVMMYSGARPGEIAQLLVDDVRQMHGVWCMHITEEGDETKSVKNKGSFRVVPIHSKLIELGFIAHVQKQREASAQRVFPEAERNERGQIAAKFERKFGPYLTKLGLKDGRGLCLYSLRHGFSDAMRRAGYMDEEFGFLMGHSKSSMTARYGQLPQGTLQKRVELIEAVNYAVIISSP